MQTQFLPIYRDITQAKVPVIKGLWLLHGDEPLLQHWFIDACRPLFATNTQTIKRFTLSSAKDWAEVITELDNLSLFADNLAIILTGKVKTDKHILTELARFANAVKSGDSQHCLIYELPKQDKKDQNSTLFQTFLQYGTVVDCQLYNEQLRLDLLQLKACELKTSLTQEAWHFLMAHTEQNLLAGHQALWRLSDLCPDSHQNPIGIDKLTQALVSDYQYNVFNLSDALLIGDTQKVLQILHHLKQVDTAPSSVLWVIAKDIRLVLSLQHTSAQSLGIWQSKIGLYQNAFKKSTIHTDHLATLYDIDALIKGVVTNKAGITDIWGAIEQLCIEITTGIHIDTLKNCMGVQAI